MKLKKICFISTNKSNSKYNNKKVIIDDIVFDSKKESVFYLKIKNDITISNIRRQVKFLLQDKFKYKEKSYRKISYIADFVYTQNNIEYVVDVKGFRTEIYKIKKKLLLNKYKNIDFIEV
jgi:hypothetical protein